MSFDSLLFLFCFLPFFLALYHIVPTSACRSLLILFSLFFYALSSPAFLFFLLGSVLLNIALGWTLLQIKDKPRLSGILLAGGVCFNLGILAFYKYSDFVISNLAQLLGLEFFSHTILIPLGLSFFSFKAVSYLADIWRGKISAFDFFQSFSYLVFFGQIISGPIARYEDFSSPVPKDTVLFETGALRFMTGLGKKVLLADTLYNVVNEAFSSSAPTTAMIWLGSLCYSLQLYYDFSGYSDMAIGIGNMLGYRCPENFDYPYTTRSFSEFWRRWHITLGSWFRDYVYIPLGGSRVSRGHLYLNLLAVWFLTGIWHGANWTFIFWGLGYFVLIALEKTLRFPDRLTSLFSKTIYRIFVLLIINFQWLLFRCSSLDQAKRLLSAMFIYTGDSASNARALFLLKDYALFIGIAILLAFPVLKILESFCLRHRISRILYQIFFTLSVMVVFLSALAFIANGQNNPFLYGNF